MELLYFIQFTTIVVLGLLLYKYGLRELKWFNASRVLLLVLIPMAAFLPLFNQLVGFEISGGPMVVFLDEVTVTAQNVVVESQNTAVGSSISWIWVVLIGIYTLGLLWHLFKLFRSVQQLNVIRKKSIFLMKAGNANLYQWEGKVPFTFMNDVFLPAHLDENSADAEMILKHESQHVQQRHWLDKFWMQVLCSVLWFFPPVFWIRKALEEVHELLADRIVIGAYAKKTYMQLLLRQAIYKENFSLNLVSPFISLTLKKRIKMMANKTINPAYRLALVGLCVLLIGGISSIGINGDLNAQSYDHVPIEDQLFLSQADSVPPSPPPPPSPPSPQNPPPTTDLPELKQIFQVVEEMPRFPGCEHISDDINERKACADKKMLEFIYENIRYPEEAERDSISGQVVVSFTVSDEGWIENPRIARDIGGGCGEEVLRVIDLMNEMEERWIPGRQRGRNVNVQYNLPVRFALQ